MRLIDQIHERRIFGRRVRVLSQRLAPLIPARARVLDVGCGDGLLASLIMRHRPDVELQGLDVLGRPATPIPVTVYDGGRIPHGDKSFDVVLFVDSLHHTPDPMVPLRARRGAVRVPLGCQSSPQGRDALAPLRSPPALLSGGGCQSSRREISRMRATHRGSHSPEWLLSDGGEPASWHSQMNALYPLPGRDDLHGRVPCRSQALHTRGGLPLCFRTGLIRTLTMLARGITETPTGASHS
jgi:SAM-dependent methyltransferase